MLDQSFSVENFIKIFEIENRKGNFNSKFYNEDFQRLYKKLIKKRREIKDYKFNNKKLSEKKLDELYSEKTEIEEEKKEALENSLQNLANKVNNNSFKFVFNKFFHEESEKEIYPVSNDGASFYAMKQLQFNIRRTFLVKQSDRYLITKQVQCLLKDNFPKIVFRTDIKSFYESVPQDKLLNQINDNQLLSPKSKTLIKSLLFSYNEYTGQTNKPLNERKGIPRGAGISAYLSELFMKEIDRQIKRADNVYYYGRYVDDIIIFLVPKGDKNANKLQIKKIQEIIKSFGISINESKTTSYNLVNRSESSHISFLGYIFEIDKGKYSNTKLSENKKDKYLTRLEKTFDAYLFESKFNSTNAYKLLIHRVNYLTKNTKLFKPKRGYVGIYYSNSLIEKDCEDLEYLDKKLKELVDVKFPVNEYKSLNRKLKSYSFKEGFMKKSFFNINSKSKKIVDLRPEPLRPKNRRSNNFEKIIAVWK